MSFYRTGLPRPVRGTAVQQPAAGGSGGLSAADARTGEFSDTMTPTHWVRIKNTNTGGGNNLRIYFDTPTRPEICDKQFVTLTPGEVLEGAFELRGLWLFGISGTATFEALLGVRVT